MPHVRMTVTIAATYYVDQTSPMSPDEVCRNQEIDFRENLNDKVARLLAFAKGPGGTITWDCKIDKEPKS